MTWLLHNAWWVATVLWATGGYFAWPWWSDRREQKRYEEWIHFMKLYDSPGPARRRPSRRR